VRASLAVVHTPTQTGSKHLGSDASCCAVLCAEPHAPFNLQCEGQHALGQHTRMVTHAGSRPEPAQDSNIREHASGEGCNMTDVSGMV
jgi:hypothetical protein